MDEEKIMPRINLGNNEVGLYPGGRGTQQSFIRGDSVPRSTPPHLIDHIWQKKVPHSSYLTKMVPFSQT